MEISIKLSMDNAAFGDNEYERGAEAARILRSLADKLQSKGVWPVQSEFGNLGGYLRDHNGNVVGSWDVTE